MPYRAKFDAADIYWGPEEVAELGATDLEVPADCDNKPGAYRAHRDAEGRVTRLDPLPPHQVVEQPGVPTIEQAFYGFLSGGASDERVKSWVAWFEKTFDARGMRK